jgi:hypothetical protein
MVVAAVSEALQRILWDAFDADTIIRPSVGSESAVVFSNPTKTARDSANRLSLWLYPITENECTKNQPMLRSTRQTSALMCTDEGREETVTDLITLQKDAQHM